MSRRFTVFILALLATTTLGLSIGRAEQPAGPGHAALTGVAVPAADQPVPVPEPSALALQYYRSGNVLWIIDQVLGLAVPAMFLLTGLSARMRNWAWTIGRKWFFALCVYFILYSLLSLVILSPWAYYTEFVRQHAYGLSNQTLQKWLSDMGIGFAVSLVFGCAVLWVPYLLIAHSPRRWWLYAGVLAVPLMLLVMLVFPVWIAPLFNKFGPMKNKPLEAKILALAHEVGIERGRVFEVDKSVDTKAVNAYVAGLGSTQRIVLWDTLLAKLDQDQVLFVMAHEMAHYVLGHVLKTIGVVSVTLLIVLWLVRRTANWLLRACGPRFGFSDLADMASLPLLILLVQFFSVLASPAVLAYSRYQEREADRFALELTRDNHAAASAFVLLQESNLANPRPGPLYVFWRGSHPSLAERIEFANTYRPWEHGQPLRYERYFMQAAPGGAERAELPSRSGAPHKRGRTSNPRSMLMTGDGIRGGVGHRPLATPLRWGPL